MKKYKYTILFIILISVCSCNSTNNLLYTDMDNEYDYNEIEPNLNFETRDDFLGDYNPIEIEELMFLQKYKNGVKPKQIRSVYLVPRNNCIELRFRDSANEIIFSLNKLERDKIIQSCNIFLNQYEEKSIPHHKVNSKTAYFKSHCNLWFGLLSASIECSKADYYVNCEFIDKRPYLLIRFTPSRCDNGKDFSPKFSLYMSPTQIRTFINQMDQENLNMYVKTLNDKAYTY